MRISLIISTMLLIFGGSSGTGSTSTGAQVATGTGNVAQAAAGTGYSTPVRSSSRTSEPRTPTKKKSFRKMLGEGDIVPFPLLGEPDE